MKNEQEKEALNRANHSDGNNVGNASGQAPDPETQNDTGYDGTTNAVSESRNTDKGYQIAPEDTMIGYDGDESQMDMDLSNEDDSRNNQGADDNG